LRTEFEDLQRFDSPISFVDEPDDTPRRRFRRVQEKLEGNLLGLLREGVLVASGYSENAAADAKPTLIAPDRWRLLTPNFLNSSAEGSGLSLSGICVFRNAAALRSQVESVDPYRSGLGGRPTMKHLIMAEFERRLASGETLASLKAEATELCKWSVRTHPDGPSPTSGTVENHIRDLHRRRFGKKTTR
jgi:hypothetical protein